MLISLLGDQNFGSRPIQDDFSSQSHYFISNFRDPKIPFSSLTVFGGMVEVLGQLLFRFCHTVRPHLLVLLLMVL